MSLEYTTERRRSPRQALTRPCKVYHVGSARYMPGTTRDVASGGALLAIDSPRPIEVGDVIDVHIGWDDRTLLSSASKVPARVMRVLRTDSPRQFVGVAFQGAVAGVRRLAA
ncbi:MAG: PilZ domain-containing protein [Planctomycetota bacterium]|nr:PilZ domain-containing protein [Planctomycetota bacterium]